MKNLFLIAILFFSVIVGGAQEKKSKKERKAEKEAKMAEQTKKLVASETWQFDANQMLPARGISKILTTSYNVVVKDNNVDSYLPYYGRVYTASYGGTDSPMIFKATIVDYDVSEGKKGTYIIKFKTKNKNDNLDYTFTVSVNGSATLSVNSTNRQHISYYGNILPIEEKEKK